MVPFAYSPDMMISPAHVNDVGEGIALAAERGRPGETTILAGESMSLREVFAIWITQPGGLKVRFFIPPRSTWSPTCAQPRAAPDRCARYDSASDRLLARAAGEHDR